jgi:hypothetical protein
MPIISTISFPLDIDDLGIVSNLGATPGAARFITVGTLGAPNAAGVPLGNGWGLTIGGAWMLDAFLNPVSPIDLPTVPPLPQAIRVPGFPVVAPGGSPLKYDNVTIVPASDGTGVGTNIPAGLYQLVTTIRYSEFAGPGSEVRVSGRGKGPLIEFFQPT